jgi:hypothetical protein
MLTSRPPSQLPTSTRSQLPGSLAGYLTSIASYPANYVPCCSGNPCLVRPSPVTSGQVMGTLDGQQPSNPGQLTGPPGQLPGTPGQLPGTPGQLPDNPGQIPSSSGHILPDTLDHIPSTSASLTASLANNPTPLPNTRISCQLHSKLG